MAEFIPEKSKQIALARLDIVHKWLEFRKKSQNKLQADYDFVKLHNTSNSHLFEILGKVSRGSLHRWYSMLNGTEDYTKLLPQYKYAIVREYRTVLNDEEIKGYINTGKLTAGHARCLVGLDNAKNLADKIIREELSVRQVEEMVSKQKEK